MDREMFHFSFIFLIYLFIFNVWNIQSDSLLSYFKQASSRLYADLLSVGERSFWRPSRFRRRTRASISTDGLLIIYLVLLTGDMKWVPNLHQCRRRKARSSSLSSRNFGGNCISGLLLVSSMSVSFLLLFLTLGFLLVSFVASVSACDVLAVRQTLRPANEPFPLLSLWLHLLSDLNGFFPHFFLQLSPEGAACSVSTKLKLS